MTPLEVRLAMIANGYNPTPLDGKRPLLNGWQNLVATKMLAQQWGNSGPNTGMLTKDTPVVDIDILDEQAAQIVEATARLFLEDKGDSGTRWLTTQARCFNAHGQAVQENHS